MIERWHERLARGEAVDPSADVAAHPHLAGRLRSAFEALRLLDAAGGGHPAARTADSLLGRRLGGHRLDDVLGAGGMGTVYLATSGEGDAGPRVAVKVIHPHLFERTGFFKRFLREAEIGRRVRHENVVRTLDADEVVDGTQRHRFLVMEYVEGRTLRDVLTADGKLPEGLCRHVGREVAAALAAIHATGAIHRDVKPENVLLTKDHVVKLMDLGVARLQDEAARVSQTGMFVGSVLYAAPEQFAPVGVGGADRDAEGGGMDSRADLHGLGLLLYEIATGVHPFQHDDFRVVMRRIADEMPRRCGEVDPQISPFFEEVVQTLLAKRPRDRFASAEDVGRVLDEGEDSAWWHERATSLRVQRKRPLRRVRIPRETALVGRDAELAQLRARYDRAKAGEGRVVLLEGEAGIGKSRLVDEFVAGLVRDGEDVNFLFGSYPPGGAATASGAFTTAYREHFGEDEQALRDALPVTPLLVPAFAALLREDAAPTGAEPLTKDSLQTVFVQATRSLAAERTTIVLVDDLHFAPTEGRSLFASLALAAPGHRVLLVGTTRPGIDATWAGQIDRLEHATHVHVSRLGPKDLVLLLRDSLKSAHLAEELSAQIAVKSDGNPFFVFEILRGLREGRFLTKRPDGTWITTQSIRELQVPSTITDIVQARISGLDLDDRNLLEVAACIGFQFDPSLVGPVLGLPTIPLLQRLGQIEKAHRLVRAAGRNMVFDHHQVQEVLYAGILEPLREAYHAGIAAAIEARTGAASKEPKDVDGAVCVELAEHFLRGAQGERARRYVDAALTHLEQGYLNDSAVRLADRAMAAGIVQGDERCELLLRCAARLAFSGRQDEARVRIEEAGVLADASQNPALRAKARVALGGVLLARQQYEDADAALASAIALARAAGERATEARACGEFAAVAGKRGRYDEQRTHVNRQMDISRDIGDDCGVASATGSLGVVEASVGNLEQALELYERAIAMHREQGNSVGESQVLRHMAALLRRVGRVEEALAHAERNMAICRRTGDRPGEARAALLLGGAFFELGGFDECLRRCEQSLAICLEVGDRFGEADALRALGVVALDIGDLDAADERLQRALVLARAMRAPWWEAYALFCLGSAADDAGDADRALAFYGESVAIRRQLAERVDVAVALVHLADLELRTGAVDRARASAREALQVLREQGMRWQAAWALAILAATPGGDCDAALAAFADVAPFKGMEAVILVLWRATGNRAHLVEARRLVDEGLARLPSHFRASAAANIRVCRETLAACREHGIE